MVNSKRVYGIVMLMLGKVDFIENTSDKKTVKEERKDLLMLQKMLRKELKT